MENQNTTQGNDFGGEDPNRYLLEDEELAELDAGAGEQGAQGGAGGGQPESAPAAALPQGNDAAEAAGSGSPASEGASSQQAQAPATPPAAPPPTAGETFKIQYAGGEKDVSREEVLKLAQQGVEHDALVTERDSLRSQNSQLLQYRNDNDEAVTFLNNLARESGKTVQEFMDSIRVERLVQQGLSRDAAQERLGREKAERKLQEATKREEAAKLAQPRAGLLDNEEVRQFYQRFPGVKPEDIPKEVWERVNRGEKLASAYETVTTQKELAEAKAQLEQIRLQQEANEQNQRNQDTSIGSQNTRGAGGGRDTFLDELLAED